MRWATRAGVHVDRAACVWLVRRFVDPDAVFVFVDDPDEVPADATPFDMRGVKLSHHVICRGLSMILPDVDVLAVTGPMFDGLYEHRRRALLLGRDPA